MGSLPSNPRREGARLLPAAAARNARCVSVVSSFVARGQRRRELVALTDGHVGGCLLYVQGDDKKEAAGGKGGKKAKTATKKK